MFERVQEIDPIRDPRWPAFLESHTRASVFHTPGWLEALRRTYGYEPFVLSTSSPTEEITNGVVFCRVSSWLTGRRIVSLPFSDHCEPLVDTQEHLAGILASLSGDRNAKGRDYIEIRPVERDLSCFQNYEKAKTFCLHRLDLRPSFADLYQKFHKDCIRRKIRRAEREGLGYTEGNSESLLQQFYRLHLLTRRRQQLPPHPARWFRNLIACLGPEIMVRVAYKSGSPIASIVTLHYKDVMVYKYGCSDARFHKLGGMQFLLGRTIEEAKANGFRELDLGRSDRSTAGLVAFKERLGATRSDLLYWRYPAPRPDSRVRGWMMSTARRMLTRMPDGVLALAGSRLYKHVP